MYIDVHEFDVILSESRKELHRLRSSIFFLESISRLLYAFYKKKKKKKKNGESKRNLKTEFISGSLMNCTILSWRQEVINTYLYSVCEVSDPTAIVSKGKGIQEMIVYITMNER